MERQNKLLWNTFLKILWKIAKLNCEISTLYFFLFLVLLKQWHNSCIGVIWSAKLIVHAHNNMTNVVPGYAYKTNPNQIKIANNRTGTHMVTRW